MRAALAILSALISALAVTAAIALVSGPHGGGFFTDMGGSLAIAVLGLANLPVLILNGLYWRLYGVPAWLQVVVILQVIPGLVCLYFLVPSVYGQIVASRAQALWPRISEAIQADDPDLLAKARNSCSFACGQGQSLNEQLLEAANAGSLRVATQLVQASLKIVAELGQPSQDLYTCEGTYLPSVRALSVAVARNNESMVRLLFPVSDEGSRKEALKTAAQTDRLEMVQLLMTLGVDLDMSGDVVHPNDTLLVAAAEGASMRTGRWLLDVQRMPANAIEGANPHRPGTAPLASLYEFENDVGESVGGSARVAEFLAMLVQHGANVDAWTSSRGTLLASAAEQGRKGIAQLLIAAGAKPELLDARGRQALEVLLAKASAAPNLRGRSDQREGCVNTETRSR